jgi:cation diffusion facilitator CzcD-associated flavoprotein CzcO
VASRSDLPGPDFDVVIVGAGLSGIGMAHHLQRRCPWARYTILEARDAIGGTWDLFRYPGVRSDSDMHTLGYSFRPWPDASAIADGGKIRTYIEDTAREAGVDRHIRFGARAGQVRWSSADSLWTVETQGGPLTCRFLIMCAGYYSYAEGHRPSWAGEADFAGTTVHPQFWPKELDWRGKQVAVIGSGATAVTLVPALAAEAAHVTMVQRSPSYVAAFPSRDRIAAALKRILPLKTAAGLTRWKNVLVQQFFSEWPSGTPSGRRRSWSNWSKRRSAPSRRATSRPATIPGTSACASPLTATCSKRSAAGALRWRLERSSVSRLAGCS